MKKNIQLVLFIGILVFMPIIISLTTIIPVETGRTEDGGINGDLSDYANPSSYYLSDLNFTERKELYLNAANKSSGLYAQCAKVYLNETDFNEVEINESIDKINSREDCSDFDMNGLLRMMYLDRRKYNIPNNLNTSIKSAILNFKYWFTEPGPDDMIFWTENHMILFHTIELLAGQLFPDEIFTNSNKTGTEHIEHALPLINRWLDWRAKLGFAEWHSNIYYRLDLTALLNLIDFAENKTIATKAEMLVDLIALDLANNYYKGVYATAHGRTEDEKQVGTAITSPPEKESTAEPAWLMLGIGSEEIIGGGNSAAVFIATGNYTTPKILEDIANATTTATEYIHKSRNNIDILEGPDYGFGYESQSDLMFWWPMSAPASPNILESSLDLINEYELAPKLVFNDEAFVDLFEIGATVYGSSLNDFSSRIKDITEGVALETANTYTYKTPYYQLSGVQDHQKGMNGLQELIWQACIDKNATIFTSSPSGLSASDQQFTSGWKPRATLHKNVGIIQYDRRAQSLILELVLDLLLDEPSYTHAYFPRWAFNEWNQKGKWVFGRRNESYVGLYSYNPTEWKSNYELRADGKKNAWIVELGSKNDPQFDSYEDFINDILNAKIVINEESMGYNILYDSPSQGKIKVGWDGPMLINSQEIKFDDYDRFENQYCNQTFGTMETIIEYNGQKLILDFINANKTIEVV